MRTRVSCLSGDISLKRYPRTCMPSIPEHTCARAFSLILVTFISLSKKAAVPELMQEIVHTRIYAHCPPPPHTHSLTCETAHPHIHIYSPSQTHPVILIISLSRSHTHTHTHTQHTRTHTHTATGARTRQKGSASCGCDLLPDHSSVRQHQRRAVWAPVQRVSRKNPAARCVSGPRIPGRRRWRMLQEYNAAHYESSLRG